jgi:integron integrase
MQAIGRPKRPPRLPAVMSTDEVSRVLALLAGEQRLLAQLLYGTGLRIAEALHLRVKDVDFEFRTLIVRGGKGGKDRAVMLPATLLPALREQLARAHVLWSADAQAGHGGVFMPDALDRKYPQAGTSWAWFWAFPQADLSVDPRTGVQRRHHVHPQSLQRAFKRAVQRAGIHRPATPHTLRHSFATHLLQSGYDIGYGRFASRGLRPHEPAPQRRFACCRTVQALLGHSDVGTTMTYTHVLKVGGGAVRSPLDV